MAEKTGAEIRYKVAKAAGGTKTLNLRQVTRLAAKGLATKTETYRKYFEDVTYPVLLKFADFQNAIDKGLDEEKVKRCIERLDTIDSNAKASGLPGVNAQQAIAAYRTLLKDIDYDVGHKDYSIIVQNLTTIREFFELGLEWFASNPDATDVTLNPGRVMSQSGEQTVQDNDTKAKIKATERDLKSAIKELNKGIVIGVSLQKLHKDSFEEDGTAIDDVLEDLKPFLTDPIQVEATKSKSVDVLTGVAKFNLEIQESEFNRNARGKFESHIAKKKQKIAKGIFSKAKDELLEEMGLTPAEIAVIEDSIPLDVAISQQFIDIALKKKPKKYTANSSRKAKARVRSPKSMPILSPVKKTIFKTPLVLKRAGKKRESSSDADTREINKLRIKINQRLPAEVRRNMGRPALINQTGRFSNSVTLTELRQGPKTLVGKYGYMFAPYETFENEGPREWPTGYNPKPLIAKSIRNLALQYTEQKLTLRRE